ncbi:hypothetical protein IAT40_002627 [Kwoniella sp. CBS 6097]
MTLPELSSKLWALVLEFCHEKGDKGLFVAQPTLAAALRVNKSFFQLAGKILYRDPTIHNLRNFLLGAADDIQASLSANTTRFHSKTPLLKHVKSLTILPLLHGTRNKPCGALPSSEYMNRLSKTKIIVTPGLDSLSLGSCTSSASYSQVGLPPCCWFDDAGVQMRVPLMTTLRPRVWCEWTYSPRPTLMGNFYLAKSILPEVINLHTSNITKNLYWIAWGTTNNIVITKDNDVFSKRWPVRPTDVSNSKTHNDEGYLMPADGSTTKSGQAAIVVSPAQMKKFDLQQQASLETGHYSEKSLARMIFSNIRHELYGGYVSPTPVHGETTLVFFGLEKLLRLALTKREREGLKAMITKPLDHAASKQVDMSSWAAYRDSLHSEAFTDFREKMQKAALDKIEKRVNTRIKDFLEKRLKQVNRGRVTIRLYLAREYSGCEACGEGKADKWTLDHDLFPTSIDEGDDAYDEELNRDDEDEEHAYFIMMMGMMGFA